MYKVNSVHCAAVSTGKDSQQEYSAQLEYISLNLPTYCREPRSELKLADLENYL